MVSPEDYERVREYLLAESKVQTARGVGVLNVVAARAKVSENDLRDIVNGHAVSEEIALAVLPLIGDE